MSYDVLDLPGDGGLSLTAYTAESASPSANALNVLASCAGSKDALGVRRRPMFVRRASRSPGDVDERSGRYEAGWIAEIVRRTDGDVSGEGGTHRRRVSPFPLHCALLCGRVGGEGTLMRWQSPPPPGCPRHRCSPPPARCLRTFPPTRSSAKWDGARCCARSTSTLSCSADTQVAAKWGSAQRNPNRSPTGRTSSPWQPHAPRRTLHPRPTLVDSPPPVVGRPILRGRVAPRPLA